MVRFSSSLEDKQPQKRNNEVREDFDLDYSRLTQSEIRQKPAYTQEVPNYVERQPQVIEYDDYDNISLDEKPQINEPLQFHPKQYYHNHHSFQQQEVFFQHRLVLPEYKQAFA